MIARVLAVLAAMALVLAFTLATVLPGVVSLRDVLADLDSDSLAALNRWGEANLPPWAWLHGMVPVMQRPAWLVPAASGLVLMGLSITLGSRKSVTRSHRRRS